MAAQRLVIGAAKLGLPATFDTTNLAVAEQQLRTLAGENRIAELRRVEEQLRRRGATSSLLEPAANDERLLKLTLNLIENGPDVPDKNPMGFWEKRTAAEQVADQPDADPARRDQINIWVVGDRAKGIVWGAIGNHLRGKMDLRHYRELGVQCSLLLPAPQQIPMNALHEPQLTMTYERPDHG